MTVTRWTQLVVLVNLLLFQLTVRGNEQTISTTMNDEALEETMNTLMDSILADLIEKYDTIKTDDFWHPYDYGTGNDNREAISVISITEQQINGKFIQWRKAQLGIKHHLVGLKESSVEIYDANLRKISTKDMPHHKLKTMEVLTRWNAEDFTPFMVLVVVTDLPSILVLALHGKELKEIGSLPLTSDVQSVMACHVENSEKIMLVPTNREAAINIYNTEISPVEAQLWFSQRIFEPGFESALVHQPDTVDSMLVISRDQQLSVYRYDALLGQFTVQQDLLLQHKCSSMQSFTMMYQHYICCTKKDTSNEAQFISYNFNTNEYEENAFNTVRASDLIPVAVSSREDLILVTRTVNNTYMNTLIYDGHGEFKPSNALCDAASCSNLPNLANAQSFEYLDNTALVLPTKTEEDSAKVLVFVTEVTLRSSPVMRQSMNLFDEFKILSNEMNRWRAVVSNADKTLKNKINTEGDNVITGNWQVKTMTAEDVDVEEGRDGRAAISDNVFNQLKFGNVEWTEHDFKSANEQVLANMKVMENHLEFIFTELQDALLKNSQETQIVQNVTKVDGLIVAENMELNTLNLKSMWNNDATEYFQSLANKQSEVLIINGGLSFPGPLTATHIETNKLKEVFVDDMAVLNGYNVFECPSIFEMMHAVKDITATVVNGQNLAESVVMAHDVSGFNFVDGIVAYMSAEGEERTPFDDVLLSSVSQTVQSPIVFGSVESHAPIYLLRLNGKNFKTFSEKIVTKTHNGMITGAKKFTGSVEVTSLFVSNSWNTFDFPVAFFPVSDESIVVKGKKSFANLVADKVSAANMVNGINTDELVSLTGTDILKDAVWEFKGRAKIVENIVVDKTVDGILMENLLHQGLLDVNTNEFAHSPNADIVFKQPVHIEYLTVLSTINKKSSHDLFENLILFEGDTCRIPGKTIIKGDATFSQIEVMDNKINGFSVENFLTRDTAQTISKPVKMTGHVFFEELNALQRFDNITVNEVLDNALRVAYAMKSEGVAWNIYFQSIACKSLLTVEHSVNGVMNYGKNAARTKGLPSQTINGPVETTNTTFSTLTVSDLSLSSGRTLQKLDVTKWIETRAQLSEPAIFNKPFFVNRMVVNGNVDIQSINGIQVDVLEKGVLRSNGKSQQFKGPVKLTKGLSVHNGDIHFHKSVDGYVLDDFIAHGFPLKGKNEAPIVIEHRFQFQSLAISEGIQVDGDVCGVNLQHLKLDSVTRNEEYVDILEKKSFTKPLDITQSLNTPQLNGKDMNKIFLLNMEHELENRATFMSNISIDSLTVNSINNVDISWLAKKFSSKNGMHVLDHDAFIKGSLKTDSLNVLGSTQSRDLEEFLTDAVQLSDPEIKFENAITMTNPILIENDIYTGVYNGIKMDDLLRKIVLLDKDITLTQPVKFTTLVDAEKVNVYGDVSFNTLTNGVDWNDLQENAIRINDDNRKIKLDSIHFEDLSVSAPVSVSRLNDKRFDEFVTLNTEQDLGALKISNVSFEYSTVNIRDNVGGYDLFSEFEDTLMSNQDKSQTVSGLTVFKKTIHIQKDLTCFGTQFTDNIVTTTEPIELMGPVEFSSPMVVEHDAQLTGHIGQNTVESIFEGSFTTGKLNEISNRWEFLGPVTFLDNVSGSGITDKVNIQALMNQTSAQLKSAKNTVVAERKRFVKTCKSLHKIRNKITKNPVKLDSFDAHQVITLKYEATNVLVLGGTDNVMLFVQTANCKLDKYHWQPASEVFLKLVEESANNIGTVDSWQSVPQKNGGSVVVFSKSKSDCSNEVGLFSVTIDINGQLSSISAIEKDRPVKSFKLVTKPDTGEIRLFNLLKSQNPGVQVFTWEGNTFSSPKFIKLAIPMDRLEVAASSHGFGIMCHNDNSVIMSDISSDQTENVTMASGAMLASKKGAMAIFESYDVLHALLAEAGTSSSPLSKPACNFQVLRLSDDTIESVQKFEVPEVISATSWSFSENTFASFLSKSNGLYVYKFMGLNGFKQVGSPYKVFEGYMLKSFSVKVSELEMAQPYMLVFSKYKIEIFRGKVFGDKLDIDFKQLCNDA